MGKELSYLSKLLCSYLQSNFLSKQMTQDMSSMKTNKQHENKREEHCLD